MAFSHLLSVLVQELFNLRHELWKMCLHDPPNRRVVDGVISVDKPVPKANDPGHRRDPASRGLTPTRKATQRLADDLEFPFDRAPEPPIVFILSETGSNAPFLHAAAGFQHIEQQLLFMAVHKRGGGSIRFRGGSRDFGSIAP